MEAQGGVDREQARITFLESEMERLTKLSEKNLSAKSQLDRTVSDLAVARSDHTIARAQLGYAQIAMHITHVRAPFDGVVVSGDLSQSLGAPVERGDILFEIAPLDSYRVILDVDERDIGAVSLEQTGSLALTGMPGDVIEIRIDKITPISAAEDGRNFFRVEASLLAEPPAILRPGMEGVAKIDVGRRRLLWIWTHELLDWLRLQLWSFLP